jgi:hypothetical protein
LIYKYYNEISNWKDIVCLPILYQNVDIYTSFEMIEHKKAGVTYVDYRNGISDEG